jgi:hypothetical protein
MTCGSTQELLSGLDQQGESTSTLTMSAHVDRSNVKYLPNLFIDIANNQAITDQILKTKPKDER